MPLVPLELLLDASPLPPKVTALLADAAVRIDAYFANRAAGTDGFVPCDHELVYRALQSLRADASVGRRWCEWGSGFGVVAGLAALLGFDACGIEVDGTLVTASRELLAAHALRVEIWPGSFVPDAYAASERLSDLETRTVLSQGDAYGDMERDIDDFDVIYAYPWPTEEEQYCDLFRRHADVGSVLLTFSRTEGVRAYRKVAGPGRRHRCP